MISTTVACACSPRSCEGFPGYPSFLPHDGNMHVKLISDSKVSIIVNVSVNASLLAVWWTGDLVGIYLSFHHVPPGECSRLLEWRSSEDAGWMCGLSRSLVWTLCQDADWMKFLPHVSTTLGFVWKVKLVSLCFIKLLRLLEKYSFQSVCAGWLYLGYLWCRKKEGHFGLSFDQIWLSPVFRYYFWPL